MIAETNRDQAPAEYYDIIVIGGGAAGIAAAVGARRCGARTLLIEQYGCLGGAATLKNVLTYCGFYTAEPQPRQVIHGIGGEVLAELNRLNALEGPIRLRGVIVTFDSEAVKITLDRVCRRSGVDLLLHTTLVHAWRENDRVVGVTVFDRRGFRKFIADAFVDASGECDLAYQSGASVRYGNHGQVNIGTLPMRLGGIERRDKISREEVLEAVKAARAAGVQGLTAETGTLVRLPISSDWVAYLVDEEYDATDIASLTAAEISGRERAWCYLEAIRRIAGCEKAFIASTGPVIGTRESRHINAHYQLKQEDVLNGAKFDDVIALGAWAVEYHARQGAGSIWRSIKDNQTFDIPLRSLQCVDTPNLFAAGRTMDGDQYAGSSVRVMGTAFATGHAAGVAAANFCRTKSIDTRAVQNELVKQGALIS